MVKGRFTLSWGHAPISAFSTEQLGDVSSLFSSARPSLCTPDFLSKHQEQGHLRSHSTTAPGRANTMGLSSGETRAELNQKDSIVTDLLA